MLDIQLKLPECARTWAGEIWNLSALAAYSDYGFVFDGRNASDEPLLKHYPRWCEPVGGLVARCLALSTPQADDVFPEPWTRAEVRIGLRPGGAGYKLLESVVISRDANALSALGVNEVGIAQEFKGFPMRASYADAWAIAEHALRLQAFGRDGLPPPKALDIPIRRDGEVAFVCARDIPEPARTVLEARIRHSTRPRVDGYPDALYVSDWKRFVGADQ